MTDMLAKASDLRAWDRQSTDTDKAFEAFSVYLRMGTMRSLAKVGRQLGKSDTLMERWSSQHRWADRCNAYDRHEARVVNEAIFLGTAEMRKRMVNQALGMQARAQQRVIKMSDEEISALKPTEIIALIRVASEMERKARDIPEDQFAFADMPVFEVQVVGPPGEGMVGVQLPDGRVGYIREARVDDFRADWPEAIVLA